MKVNDQAEEVVLEGAKFRLFRDEECKDEVFVKKSADGESYIVINEGNVGSTTLEQQNEMRLYQIPKVYLTLSD
ncbi:hypothetical protein SD457_12505 [Coprobacillaceae bacterium CR2/5/TPMF4]|nr:hypothetical protein SD457_12505 [Coprobacillaceae bacterium CR2/5/TPMF4]